MSTTLTYVLERHVFTTWILVSLQETLCCWASRVTGKWSGLIVDAGWYNTHRYELYLTNHLLYRVEECFYIVLPLHDPRNHKRAWS